jgi:hypothetical protein
MNKKDLFEKLANNEELIGKLYKLYSQKYSKYSDFWRRLSDDERSHAAKIRSFAGDENVDINANRFKAKDISALEKKVSEEIASFEKNDISLAKALKIALSLEDNLTEKKFFEIFDTDSERVKFYLGEMEESIGKHRERVKKMIEKIK